MRRTRTMEEPETAGEAIDRLTADGYTVDFRAEPGGLRDVTSQVLYRPGDLVADWQARFEGMTDPDEGSIVFALRTRDGTVRGTYSTAFGPLMDAVDADAVRHLGTGS